MCVCVHETLFFGILLQKVTALVSFVFVDSVWKFKAGEIVFTKVVGVQV